MKTLSRNQASKVTGLNVDPWGHISSLNSGMLVHGWTTGKRRRVDRISVAGVLGKTNAVETLREAKRLHSLTGLITHFHFGVIRGAILENGTLFSAK